MRLVDSHCHLQVPELRASAAALVREAREAGFEEILVAGVVPSESADTAAFAAELGVWCSVGCHPCDADKWDPEPILEQIGHPRVVAVGECGLDFFHKPYDAALQESVLRRQVEIARSASLPLIIHNRKSNDDVVRILRDAGADRGVFHCFSADRRTLDAALELGFHVSFSGTVTFANASVRELVPLVPEDRILVETDSPWLAPHPHRGSRNRPALARLVLDAVAELRGQSASDLGDAVVENFHRCFPRSAAG